MLIDFVEKMLYWYLTSSIYPNVRESKIKFYSQGNFKLLNSTRGAET